MPSSTPTHDLVILGGGSGGYAAALRAAELGLTVALVEKGKLGGTCLHSGCVPTKALLHAAEVADSTRESATFGVNATFEGIDMGRVNSYKEGIIGRLHKGLQGLVNSRKVEYVEGEGRLTAPNTVTVGDRELVGKDVVLATGSRPKLIPGLEVGGRVMTSEQALQLAAHLLQRGGTVTDTLSEGVVDFTAAAQRESGVDGIFLALRGSAARTVMPKLAEAGLAGKPRVATSALESETGKAADDAALDGIAGALGGIDVGRVGLVVEFGGEVGEGVGHASHARATRKRRGGP